MVLNLHLRTKSEAISQAEIEELSHPPIHWLLVVIRTLLTSVVFTLVGFLVGFNGLFLFQSGVAWLQFLVGLPLSLMGVSIILINLYQLLAAILDRRYSKTHCPFCQKEAPLT